MQWLNLAVKIITAIPTITSLFEKLVDLYYNKKISEAEGKVSDKAARRKALMNSIANAKDKNDRKELSILLHKHNIGKL